MKKTIAQQLNVTDFPFRINNKEGEEIYYEDSDGYWWKREYDLSGSEIYYEDSSGLIKDNLHKEDDVITLNGKKYKRIEE